MTTDERPSLPPSSEDVALALRHCWQPVARLQDLEDGPQRAVLLDEPLAVFLTDSGEAAVVALGKAAGLLRSEATRALGLRFAPELSFVYDSGQDAATRIDEILHEIEQERKKR